MGASRDDYPHFKPSSCDAAETLKAWQFRFGFENLENEKFITKNLGLGESLY